MLQSANLVTKAFVFTTKNSGVFSKPGRLLSQTWSIHMLVPIQEKRRFLLQNCNPAQAFVVLLQFQVFLVQLEHDWVHCPLAALSGLGTGCSECADCTKCSWCTGWVHWKYFYRVGARHWVRWVTDCTGWTHPGCWVHWVTQGALRSINVLVELGDWWLSTRVSVFTITCNIWPNGPNGEI